MFTAHPTNLRYWTHMSKHDLFSISCPGPHEKGVWCKKCNGDGIPAGGSDFKPVKAPKKSAWQK